MSKAKRESAERNAIQQWRGIRVEDGPVGQYRAFRVEHSRWLETGRVRVCAVMFCKFTPVVVATLPIGSCVPVYVQSAPRQ